MFNIFIHVFLKFFFIFIPFCVLSTFLSLTQPYEQKLRKTLAIKIGISSVVMTLVLYIFGSHIFELFGINLDSFRIGTGILLMLTAINLINGDQDDEVDIKKKKDPNSIIMVPMVTPVICGPAVIGAIIVMAKESVGITKSIVEMSAVIFAIFIMTIMLYMSSVAEKILSKRGLLVLSKMSGLILSAISAQMIMSGVVNFFKG